ncbi:Canalicular multispecific organic anion transporter 1 [Varanus komodoensis]|nr:Canalicular multispecific organic anion transporter 1 [Varanus komodoensis]
MAAADLQQFCGSVFWDSFKVFLLLHKAINLGQDSGESTFSLTTCPVTKNSSLLDRDDADLTLCFEQTVLVWIPLGFLWLFGPWQLLTMCTSKRKKSSVTRIYLTKQLITGLLALVALSELLFTVIEDSNQKPMIQYTNPALYIITWMLVILIQDSHRFTLRRDSWVLFLFLIISIVCGVFQFQTLIRKAVQRSITDIPRFSFFLISYGFQLILFFLSVVSDIAPEMKEAAKKNPEITASFLSFITFHWYNRYADPDGGENYMTASMVKLGGGGTARESDAGCLREYDVLCSMVVKGYRKPLQMEDLWELRDDMKTQHMLGKFEEKVKSGIRKARRALDLRKRKRHARATDHMNGLSKSQSQDVLVLEEKQRKKKEKVAKGDAKGDYPKSWLMVTLIQTFSGNLLKSVAFKLAQDLLLFVSPQLLKLMINFVSDQKAYPWLGYLYAVLLFVTALLQSICLQQYFQLCFELGMSVRTVLMAAIYKKALSVSNVTRKESTVGETVNLMSVDAQRFMDFVSFVHQLWSAPVQIALAIMFLWWELGPSVLAGIGVMVLLIPVNAALVTKARTIQMKNMKHKDERMKVMNEILSGIKILKLFAWEPSFQKQVQRIRTQELKGLLRFAYLQSVSFFCFNCAPFLVSVITFAVYIMVDENNVLDAQKAFTSISFFNILRFPLSVLPMVLSSLVQVSVSVQRLERYLGSEDLNTAAIHHDRSPGCAVSFSDASFAWEQDSDATIRNINLEIPHGHLLAVVGPVGSGKSSLVSAMLGEMENIKGHINIQGSVAYMPQQAWIQNATLKDNILFGSSFDEARYQQVLEACALLPDLQLLPGGDLTEIGEKGINLSGGQKQRVSLARAVYSNADIYLLDDPLSAVDSHVGRHIFEKVLGPEGLLQHKTRILVTHSLSFLAHVDDIVVLEAGAISERGSYSTLLTNGEAFAQLLSTYGNQQENKPEEEATVGISEEVELEGDIEPGSEDVPADVVTMTQKSETSVQQRNFSRSLSINSTMSHQGKLKEKKPVAEMKGQRLIEKEAMETGKVKLIMYLQYMRAVGWGFSAWILISYILQAAFSIGSNLWLSDWTNDASLYQNETYPASQRDMRIGVYGALGVGQALFLLTATAIASYGAMRASRFLHDKLLTNILHVPMSFFDSTPIGRIVNRFAKV